jgi:capsular polysaccharide biosynthesis protein
MKTLTTPYSAAVIKRTEPLNYRASDHALFDQEWEKTVSGSEVFETSDVRVGRRLVFYKGFLPNKSVNRLNPRYSYESSVRAMAGALRELFLLKTILVPEAVWIIDEWSQGYFHWITEALPRLLNIRLALPQHSLIVTLPAHYARLPFVGQTLELFDTSAAYFTSRQLLKIGKMIFATPVTPGGNYQPRLMIELQRYILDRLGLDAHPAARTNRKIYVSRKNAERRKVRNEQELIPVFQKFGVEVVQLEDLTFAEQVRMMNDSSLLISIHGAGLTNMLFMKNDTMVLELRKKNDGQNNCYFSLASSVNIKYLYLQCEAIQPEDHHTDLMVDSNELSLLLEKYL